jgi:rhamnulokinase
MAAAAPPFKSFVDPDAPRFAEPGDMPGRIRTACEETGQPVPDSPGEIVRCALESLALKCRHVLGALARLTGDPVEVLHVVGGGVQNELLNEFTAGAAGKPVIAGPIEATAAGNVMVQAMAQGHVGSLEELRQVVAASTELRRYEPCGGAEWAAASERFEALLST